ncbi:CAP domain-containing protein [Streptomyces sp. FH025]|uniref:CAP domain-containing protein n=1 Tax=Streptomyces sp. FH025 TaxID=2815937 RepID=UPI001A9F2FBC|nr:CAP domain-containing protein [Streptomyces sp. FH025]MBO1414871.1 CAP domain-containing protein [Streptomyces sp. FH025]
MMFRHEDTAPSSTDPVQTGYANLATLCQVWAERSARGLPFNPAQNSGHRPLMSAARGHVEDAVALRWWGPGKDPHTNPQTGSTPGSRIQAAGYCPNPTSWRFGEITYTGAGGAAGTPRAAINWWLNSPGHRAILLDPGLLDVGVGVRPGSADQSVNGADAGTYVVDFGFCQQ